MACNESDEKLEIQFEILRLEKELENLGEKAYQLSMQRKFIHHRLSDLNYRLKEIDGLIVEK